MARKPKKPFLELKSEQLRDIYGVSLLALALFSGVSILGYGSIVGELLNRFFKSFLGVGWYIVPVLLICWAMVFFVERWRHFIRSTGIGLVVMLLSLIAFIHVGNPSPIDRSWFDPSIVSRYGGYLGAVLSYMLVRPLGKAGAYIILTALTLIGLILASRVSLSALFGDVFHLGKNRMSRFNKPLTGEPSDIAGQTPGESAPTVSDATHQISETIKIEEASSAEHGPAPIKQLHDTKYRFPPLDILNRSESRSDKVWKKNLNERIKIVEKTLENFGVDATVTRVVRGPTITRFELQLGTGVKVNRIVSLADDLAVALATQDVRILTPVPGKSAVGIEIPNDTKELVTLGDVLVAAKEGNKVGPLIVGLGKDISGAPVMTNLTHMPHLLISGATGSGKTTCVNSIITSLLFFSHPEQVKLILIDPKMVELSHYHDIPHLITPVITDAKKASMALKWAVREMEDRFKILAESGSRNIEQFNKVAKPEERLPYIMVVIDELADLMMISPQEVEESICRLAQMGRAIGINLVVATQRPSVDVITGLIKANIPSRISFEVASQADSRVILDIGGAEKLIGRGDMLFMPAGSVRPKRVQGALLVEHEIAEVTAFIKSQRDPDYDDSVIKEEQMPWSTLDYVDPLLEQAIEIIVRTGQASISMLQRRLRIGYSRAARLIDTMEERGIVGGADGSRARAVLLSEDEYDRLKSESSD